MKGVIGWFLHRATGVILLIGLLVHFVLLHYSGAEQLDPEVVIARLSSPFWMAFNFIFLVSAVYHGFYGVWGIAIEYLNSDKHRKLAKVSITGAACVVIAAGIYILSV